MQSQREVERFAIENFQVDELDSEYVWLRVNDHAKLLRKAYLMQIVIGRLTAGWIPCCMDWLKKERMARFAYEDIQHASLIKKRMDELSGGSKLEMPETMHLFFKKIGEAGNVESFWHGMFLVVKKQLLHLYEDHLQRCDPLFDAPTVDVLEAIIPQLRSQIAVVNSWLKESLAHNELRESMLIWANYVNRLINQLGGMNAWDASLVSLDSVKSPVDLPMGPAPDKISIPEWLNNKVQDYNLITKDQMPLKGTLRETIWHLATEMQAVDQMAYLFYGLEMPFEFFVDFSRHMWDECRHSLIGVRRLSQLGYDYKMLAMPYKDTPPESLKDYFGMLTMIGEACSFGRKKQAIGLFYANNDPLSAIHQEYDCSDEHNHVRYGKKWLPMMMEMDEKTTSLQDLIEQFREKTMSYFVDVSDEERKQLVKKSSGFCAAVELKNLNFDVY